MDKIELEAYCKWMTDKFNKVDAEAKSLRQQNAHLKEQNTALAEENKKLKSEWKHTDQYAQMNEKLKTLQEEKKKLTNLRDRLLFQLNTKGGSK
jgi:regulator of replication initiation timing